MIGCNSKKATATNGEKGKNNDTEIKDITLDNNFQQPKENPSFEVLDASISGDILTVKISYSGGCEEHVFNAYFNGMYMKSEPPKAGIFIEHVDNDDSCRELITEEIQFDLTNMRYPGKEKDYKVMVGMNHFDSYLPYEY